MENFNKFIPAFILLVLGSNIVLAQGPPPPPPPPGLPIDGGVLFMILAALGYGYKRLK